MSEKKASHPPTTFTVGRLRRVLPGEDVRWKGLCADHPELDPRKAERLLDRLPKALIDDCMDSHLVEFYQDWEAAQGDPPLSLGVSAEGDGFFCSVMGEYYRGAAGCVTAALEEEGYAFTKFQLWPPSRPSPDVQEPPLFVIEAQLAGPLPEGIATPEEATQRLLARLRPAFALLKQGQFGRAQSQTGGFAVPEASAPAPDVLSPR